MVKVYHLTSAIKESCTECTNDATLELSFYEDTITLCDCCAKYLVGEINQRV